MTMQRDGMRLTVVAGVLLIALLTLVPSQALGQDDLLTLPAPGKEQPREIRDNHKCEPVRPGEPYGLTNCIQIGNECQGMCYKGTIVAEDGQTVMICKPSPGSRCVASPRLVPVYVEEQASCRRTNRGCECGTFAPPPPGQELQYLPAYVCN